MKPVFVYCTCATVDEARKIAEVCIDDRLAACANIVPEMESYYRWEGKTVNDKEVILIFKTTTEAVPFLKEKVMENHSYTNPAFVFWELDGGSEPYLNWISEEVMPKTSSKEVHEKRAN